MSALFSEIERQGREYRDYVVDTVFFGGGTPTVIPAQQLAAVLESIKKNFKVDDNAEITIESNPGTMNTEMLEIYKRAGVNRLSIGVQSLDNRVLSALGRIHTAEVFRETYKAARNAGFHNINLDFMFSVPFLSEKLWEETLLEALHLRPEHISFYSLQLEEGTEFYRMYREGTLEIADDETDRRMYHRAVDLLTKAGYLHYEISNAALPGFESRHNMKYWSFDDYLGLGLGASSFVCGRRFTNPSHLDEYAVLYGTSKKESSRRRLPFETAIPNTEADSVFEYIFTGLRRINGIELTDFRRRFGKDFADYYPHKVVYIKEMTEQGFLFFRNGRFGLTPAGIDISNGILSEFADPKTEFKEKIEK